MTEQNYPPIRVCIVAPSLGILGGQAVQALRLQEHLNFGGSVKADILAVNPRLPGPLGKLQAIKFLRTVVTSILYVTSLLTRLHRYDIVHAFSASYWSFVLAPLPAMLVGRLYGKKVVLNYHSGEAEDHFTKWPTAVLATRLAHAVVVPSDYLVAVLGRFNIHAQAIGNFVDLQNIPYRKRTVLQPKLLSNRNLEPLYNVACVLRAFAIIQREIPTAHLVIAGFGSQRAELEQFARSFSLNVEFLGRVASENMPALYDQTDVFINGSDIDNMPLSILDAFAAGVPVVSTDAGGIPYIVRDEETGMLVPRGDADALAAATLRLFSDRGLVERITLKARNECVARFSWPAVESLWLSLYSELVHPGF